MPDRVRPMRKRGQARNKVACKSDGPRALGDCLCFEGRHRRCLGRVVFFARLLSYAVKTKLAISVEKKKRDSWDNERQKTIGVRVQNGNVYQLSSKQNNAALPLYPPKLVKSWAIRRSKCKHPRLSTYCDSYTPSLTVGSAVGSIRDLFAKIKAIDAKHGKFNFVLCTGDFFGPLKSSDEPLEEEENETDLLLDGKIEGGLASWLRGREFELTA